MERLTRTGLGFDQPAPPKHPLPVTHILQAFPRTRDSLCVARAGHVSFRCHVWREDRNVHITEKLI